MLLPKRLYGSMALLQHRREIRTEIAPRRPGDPARLIACSDRARSVLGWKPKFESAHQIIESAWKWQLKHPNGYAN